MLQKYYYLYLILLLAILQSCSSNPRSAYYVPEENNMLKLAKKNDIKAAVSTSNITQGNNNNASLFNAQIAYSPIKHLGVFGNFLKWENNSDNFLFDPTTGISTMVQSSSNYKLGSGAIGGYYLYQTDNQRLRSDTIISQPIGFLLDGYVGIGRGNTDNVFSLTSNSFLKFNKTYGQLGIHWQDEYVGLSIVHRFGQLNFFEGILNGNAQEGSEVFVYLTENQKQKFRETSFKLFMGTKEIRGFFSVTTVNLDVQIPNNGTFFYYNGIPHVNTTANIGVVLSIDEIYSYFKNSKK